MRIEEIEWNQEAIVHIARHGVNPEEVEEVCFQGNPYILKGRQNRYFVMGQTESGRYLTIVFVYLGQNKAKIITARAMSEAEQRLYRRR